MNKWIITKLSGYLLLGTLAGLAGFITGDLSRRGSRRSDEKISSS